MKNNNLLKKIKRIKKFKNIRKIKKLNNLNNIDRINNISNIDNIDNIDIVDINKKRSFSILNFCKSKYVISFILVLIIFLFVSGFSIGKSLSNFNIATSGKIGQPILIVDSSNEITINNLNRSGEYIFKVKNFNSDGKISDVNMEYYIEVFSNDVNKLKDVDIKIYKDDYQINLINNRTDKFFINNKNPQEDCFKIIIDCNSSKISEIVDCIQVKVHSNQVNKVV